ncbi:MAG: acetoacetate decarboxylase family protein [Blastocatellia bacterium]|nr:acetoacetate decarboxylase family protein [Blastocatellia bacterium]
MDSSRARAYLPPFLKIVEVFPGKTLAGVYVTYYKPGSTLEYNEALLSPALVSYKGKVGFWVSHIYVDSEESMIGGRLGLGMPKEIAGFRYAPGQKLSVTVVKDGDTILSLSCSKPFMLWRQNFKAAVFGLVGKDLIRFSNNWNLKFGFTKVSLDIGLQSPLHNIKLGSPIISVYGQDINALLGKQAKLIAAINV